MAEVTTSTPTSVPKEKTFSSYNQDQGKNYAKLRRTYHPSVVEAVINQHTTTGGKLDTLLDIGCGPGTATFDVASHFPHAIGLDPSEGMIATARAVGGTTSTGEAVRFEISTAEDLGVNLSPPVANGSIDLIIAANAAHWFDMAGFWRAAARVLKPGGSVAMWTSGNIAAHPDLPNAAAIQAAIDEHQEKNLLPYFESGNFLTRNSYKTLPLPWTLKEPITAFDKGSFFRREWQINETFYVGPPEVDLDTFEKMVAVGSAETRWRQAHPDDVGTERDIIKILRKKIEHLLHEAGVKPGEERLKGVIPGVLLVVKKV
jgi:trans-aconitate 3-methyltransferase